MSETTVIDRVLGEALQSITAVIAKGIDGDTLGMEQISFRKHVDPFGKTYYKTDALNIIIEKSASISEFIFVDVDGNTVFRAEPIEFGISSIVMEGCRIHFGDGLRFGK